METASAGFIEMLVMLFSIFLGTPMVATEMPIEQPVVPVEESILVSGSFESVMGVMDELSCHCENGIYISDELGDTVPVCLDVVTSEVPTCRIYSAEGPMTMMEGSTDEMSPCSSNSMSVLMAEHGVCEF